MLFLPCEDRDRCLRTRKQALARRHICWQLDLGLPASRTMRNRLLLLTSRPACLCYGGRNGLSHMLSSEVRREPRMRACHLPRRCPPALLLGPCTRVPVPAPNSLSHSRSGTGQGLGGEPVGPGTADLRQALHVQSLPRRRRTRRGARPPFCQSPLRSPRTRECLLSTHYGNPGACFEASARWRGPTRWAALSLSSGTCPPSGQARGVGLSADIREVRSSHTSSSLSEAMNVNMALPREAPAGRSTGDLVPLPCEAKAAGG